MTEYDEQEHIALERADAQKRYSRLILKLAEEKQTELIVKAAANPKLLEEFYKKYNL